MDNSLSPKEIKEMIDNINNNNITLEKIHYIYENIKTDARLLKRLIFNCMIWLYHETRIKVLHYLFNDLQIDPHFDSDYILFYGLGNIYEITEYMLTSYTYNNTTLAANSKYHGLRINYRAIKLLLKYGYNIQFIIDRSLTDWYDIDLETLNIINNTYQVPEYIFMIYVFHRKHNHVQLLLDSGKFDINMYNCDPIKTAFLNCDNKMIRLLAGYGIIHNDFDTNPIDDLQQNIVKQTECVRSMTQLGVSNESIIKLLINKIALLENLSEAVSHHSDWEPIITSSLLYDRDYKI